MVVATRVKNSSRDKVALTCEEMDNVASSLNKHQNILTRWPASQFSFVQGVFFLFYVCVLIFHIEH